MLSVCVFRKEEIEVILTVYITISPPCTVLLLLVLVGAANEGSTMVSEVGVPARDRSNTGEEP